MVAALMPKVLVLILGPQKQSENSAVCSPYALILLRWLIVQACDHPQGSGKVVHRKCNVKFDIFIPVYWDRFPFVILVTRGSHTHHPPRPEKLPADIAEQVVEAIKEQELLSLTARKFNIYYPYLLKS
jgi:hypothetical protein